MFFFSDEPSRSSVHLVINGPGPSESDTEMVTNELKLVVFFFQFGTVVAHIKPVSHRTHGLHGWPPV